MTRYQDVTDTAKAVRKWLKREYPGIKFSVRSSRYAGGASIRVAWIDGPPDRRLWLALKAFASVDYIDQTDYAVESEKTIEGETVWPGADYVTTARERSDRLRAFAWQLLVNAHERSACDCKHEQSLDPNDQGYHYAHRSDVGHAVHDYLPTLWLRYCEGVEADAGGHMRWVGWVR